MGRGEDEMAWYMAKTGRWLLISAGITIVATAILWQFFGPRALFGFLFLPFLGFGGRRQGDQAAGPNKSCPRCGRVGRDPTDAYCPRDGMLLS